MLLELGSDRIGAELTKALLEKDAVTVEIEAYTTAAAPILVDEFRFEDVQITGQETIAGAALNLGVQARL